MNSAQRVTAQYDSRRSFSADDMEYLLPHETRQGLAFDTRAVLSEISRIGGDRDIVASLDIWLLPQNQHSTDVSRATSTLEPVCGDE